MQGTFSKAAQPWLTVLNVGAKDLVAERQLEDYIRVVMERARRRRGLSAEKMVELLGGLQSRGATSRNSWYLWQEKPASISAPTFLAAAVMAGVIQVPSAAGETPIPQEAATTDDGDRQRLAAVEDRLAKLDGLDERVRKLALLVARIADRLGESGDEATGK